MGGGKTYTLRRECTSGEPYEVSHLYSPGRAPRITYPSQKQCPSCGRYRLDPARRRGGRFDPRYERS